MALLRAIGIDVSNETAMAHAIHELEGAGWRQPFPPVVVASGGSAVTVPICLSGDLGSTQVVWTVQQEDGEIRNGRTSTGSMPAVDENAIDGCVFRKMALLLPALPLGYHQLSIEINGAPAGELQLIVTPVTCYEPPMFAQGVRLWGIAVQLYSLRSACNWGIGDFRDLLELVRLAAPLGCNLIGLSPLHALSLIDPLQMSPYSPSSRQAINVLYISIEATHDFAESPALQAQVGGEQFQERLRELRRAPNVDYVNVAKLKLEILQCLYQHFRQHHLLRDTPRGTAFREFMSNRGEPLRRLAIFDAVCMHLRAHGVQSLAPSTWPPEYCNWPGESLELFATGHAERIEYFCYLQWLASEQLEAAQAAAVDSGMAIGLYGDLAVGTSHRGCEVWENRGLYCAAACVGAPPDWLVPDGQDWGLPPMHPAQLRAQQYRPFIELIRASMRGVGALRLDHISMLYRLWWLPRGARASSGAYVHYPLVDLLRIVALESQRNRCLIIGEDLGTVDKAVTAAMDRFHVYHYCVMLFEQTAQGDFKLPSEYPRRAVAVATTHDLPTLRGWWEGHDIALRHELGLYESQIAERLGAERARERGALMQALTAAGIQHRYQDGGTSEYDPSLAPCMHEFLSCSDAALILLQIEDLIGMREPVNIPGTDTEHPNWQRKVAVPTTEIFSNPAVRRSLARIDDVRRPAASAPELL